MTDAAAEPFFIGMGEASPDASVELLGCKAAQLSRMSRLGLAVPPAFVMPTSLCDGVNRKDATAQHALKNGLRLGIARLEAATGRRFGDSRRSGAGVAFSRNPATGANELYVDFLFDAQGEDVVSGRRTPGDAAALEKRMPEAAGDLAVAARRLEQDCKDVQDIEFTVEDGKLYFLQTRTAQRTPRAALRIAVDLAREGLIAPADALRRLAGVDIDRAGRAALKGGTAPLAKAVSASPGVASGRIALDSEAAARLVTAGEPVILVRREPSTDDVAEFNVAAGILTVVGGRTAHAAVVARQLGKACLVGCGGLKIDEARRRIAIAGRELKEGDWLSIDGESGEISAGRAEIVIERPEAELAELKRWREQLGESGQKTAADGAAS